MHTRFNKSSYLAHHGVLGQKWGVRRYRNKDGTLTNLGKKKASTYAAKYNKVTGKDVRDHEKNYGSSSTNPKPLQNMSNDELKSATERYKLESSYIEERRKNNSIRNQKPKPKGAKGAAMYWYDKSQKPITDAYQDIMKETLKHYGKKALGVPVKDDKKQEKEKGNK